jgi:hypothetical protein
MDPELYAIPVHVSKAHVDALIARVGKDVAAELLRTAVADAVTSLADVADLSVKLDGQGHAYFVWAEVCKIAHISQPFVEHPKDRAIVTSEGVRYPLEECLAYLARRRVRALAAERAGRALLALSPPAQASEAEKRDQRTRAFLQRLKFGRAI